MIRTRFAPSPTGELHIGSARTALFAYLFAKHSDGLPADAPRPAMPAGQFLLRIEDTDQERSTKEFEKNIFAGLSWLGISHDGDILYQYGRLDEYQKVAEQLIKNGFAVRENGAVILKAKDTLDKLGIEYEEVKKIFADSNNEDSDQKVYPERSRRAYLLKNIGDDLIHGKISGTISDTVLLRSSGTPTFHLAVIIDDEFMGITHVIRGDDHLSNTPLHIVLQKALNYKVPKYVHIPMILGPDRSKLSKRHAATSVLEYKKLGYLPEAIVNFIALLGWNPKDEREIFSMAELVKEFDLSNVNKASAIFDIEKLNWMNEHYIKDQISKIKMTDQSAKMLKGWGIDNLLSGELELVGRGGYKTLKEAADYIIKLRLKPEYVSSLLIFKKSDKGRTAVGLNRALEKLQILTAWSEEDLNQMLSDVVKDNNLSNGDVFWPVRVALCGGEKSPSPVELLLALGKDEAVARIEKATEKLKNLRTEELKN